jgi:hypothetical protein
MAASLSPHLTSGANSPLSALLRRALVQYGDMAASTSEGDVALLMLDFANQIIEDVREHPYFDNAPVLQYYESLEDTRPVADSLVIAGLLAKYAAWNSSEKANNLEARYFMKLNSQMYYAATGGSIALELQVLDQNGR